MRELGGVLTTPNQVLLGAQILKETFARAREARLIIKEVADEVLVYDLETDQAHCLNQTAAVIWKNCNGQRTVAQLRELMERESDSRVADEIVWLALNQLAHAGLLERIPEKPAYLAGMGRRQLAGRIGIAVLTLPVILSIVSPTPAQAGSPCTTHNRPDGCPCDNSGQCISSHHCRFGMCEP